MAKLPHVRMRDVVRIYDSINVGLLLCDGKGMLIWGNKYYSDLAQFNVEKYYGRDIREISRREDVQLSNGYTMIDVIMETGKPHSQVVRYPTEAYVICTGVPVFDDNGNMDYIIYTMTNYNELMDMQQQLTDSTRQALALESHLRTLQIERNLGNGIVVADKKMYDLYEKALRLASTPVSVMLTGESGVGKDVLAKFIHQNSPRKDEKFIHVNMATIPRSLFESELFGYTPGSFTGAAKYGKDGLIQLANNGTLFLDEIGELPLDIQVKLLQVIQEKRVRAIGATESTYVDFRIICATNRNLKEMVKNHEFRLDLYYRLNTIELSVPPLRERPADIPRLATYFLEQFNRKNESQKYFSSEIIRIFYKYAWPGNVRELQHTVESLVALCPDRTITADQLPPDLLSETTDLPADAGGFTLKEAVENLESRLIREALARCKTAALAAEELGIDASTLSKKRKRYGI